MKRRALITQHHVVGARHAHDEINAGRNQQRQQSVGVFLVGFYVIVVAEIKAHIHAHQFKTVVGDIAFGGDGEWAQSRMMFTQFQNVTGNDIDQFKDSTREVIVWPAEYKTGNLIYPYAKARSKK